MSHNKTEINTLQRNRTTQAQEESENDTKSNTCPESNCNGTIIENKKNGEKYCKNCGLVINEDMIDPGPDWSRSSHGSSNKRASTVTTLRHDKGLYTEVATKRDGYGNTLDAKTRRKFSRLNKHHKWSQAGNSKEVTMRGIITEIRRMASALGIPKQTQKLAINLARQLHEKEDLIGHSIESVACTTLHISTKFQQITRPISEIETVARVDEQSIIATYKFTRDTLDINLPPANPKEYIDRYATKIGLEKIYGTDGSESYRNHIKEAKNLVDVVLKSPTESGMSRQTIAVIALYNVALKNGTFITQAHFEKNIDITSRSIRNHYKEILEIDPTISKLPEDIESKTSNEIFEWFHDKEVTHEDYQ